MSSILEDIRKKRNAAQQLNPIDAQKIRNAVCIMYSPADQGAQDFCGAVEKMVHTAFPVEFVSQSESPAEAVKAAPARLQVLCDRYMLGSRFDYKCVYVIADAKGAAELAKQLGSDANSSAFVVCCGEEEPAPEQFCASLLYFPDFVKAKKDRVKRADAARLFAMWIANLVEGQYQVPYEEMGSLHFNRLYGYCYDCVEERMRYNALCTVTGMTACDDQLQKNFIEQVDAAIAGAPLRGVNGRAVNLAGYESIAKTMSFELSKDCKGLIRLLCKFFKSLRKKHSVWTQRGKFNAQEVTDALFGRKFLQGIFNLEDADVNPSDYEAFQNWWSKREDAITNVTLKMIVSAADKNGFFLNRVQEMQTECQEEIAELKTAGIEQVSFKSPALADMLRALGPYNKHIVKIEELRRKMAWYLFVAKKIRKLVEDQKLSEKLRNCEEWKAELQSTLEVDVPPKTKWDVDPIPFVPAADLTDDQQNRFDVDAGLRAISDRLRNFPGKIMLFANASYINDDWGKPSERPVGLDCAEGDSFHWTDSLTKADLVAFGLQNLSPRRIENVVEV